MYIYTFRIYYMVFACSVACMFRLVVCGYACMCVCFVRSVSMRFLAFLLLFATCLLEQALGLRAAVLFVGEFRGWLVTRHTYQEYLVNYNRQKGHDIDIFVSTYETTLPSDEEVSDLALKSHQV